MTQVPIVGQPTSSTKVPGQIRAGNNTALGRAIEARTITETEYFFLDKLINKDGYAYDGIVGAYSKFRDAYRRANPDAKDEEIQKAFSAQLDKMVAAGTLKKVPPTTVAGPSTASAPGQVAGPGQAPPTGGASGAPPVTQNSVQQRVGGRLQAWKDSHKSEAGRADDAYPKIMMGILNMSEARLKEFNAWLTANPDATPDQIATEAQK